jgi:hypothetical protein
MSAASKKAWRERQKAKALDVSQLLTGTSVLTDAEGNEVLRWTKTKTGIDPAETVRIIKGAFENYESPVIPTQGPRGLSDNCLVLYPLPDLHIGQYCWASEVDNNWDLDTAKRVIGSSFARVVEMTPPTELAVILGGGDQLHADSNEERTRRSGHKVQVDDRHSKVLATACKIFVDTIDLALGKHQKVEVRILQGNHDETASTALAYFLSAWFRSEPRVLVDISPSLFFWKRYGSVFLAATHGHEAKPGQMAGIMAARRPEDWGLTKHRYAHTFHVHHQSKFISEGGGATVETHQTPIPQDAFNYGMGFLSGRSLQSITYHKDMGEVGRTRWPVQ